MRIVRVIRFLFSDIIVSGSLDGDSGAEIGFCSVERDDGCCDWSVSRLEPGLDPGPDPDPDPESKKGLGVGTRFCGSAVARLPRTLPGR